MKGVVDEVGDDDGDDDGDDGDTLQLTRKVPKAIPAYFAFGKNPLISMNTRKKKALTRIAFEILNLFNIYFCNS